MNRVLILGCAGAGKTHLARKLTEITGLPLVHLDREYWQPGWRKPDRTQWEATARRLADEPRWIMDGQYLGTLPVRLARADTVVFLDVPRRICLRRVLVRTLANLGRARAEMREGCPERFDWGFLEYIWAYPHVHRPRVVQALRGFDGALTVCRTQRDVADCLAAFGRRSTE